MTLTGEFGGKSFLLASAAIGLSAGMTATLFYSLGSFIPSLQAEFGWSRGDISLAVTLMTLAVFVSGATAGRLCDRYGAANIGAASLVAYALAVVLLVATTGSIELFWALYALIALLGVGSTPIVLVRPIAAAFEKQRGLALGIALTGAGLAGFWVPQMVAMMTEAAGWRAAYLALAGIAIATAPIVWFGFRSVPQDRKASATVAPPVGMTAAEARRTNRFWLLTVVSFAMAAGLGGVVVHLVPLLRDLGADPLAAAGTASLVGLSSVVGRLGIGLLLDRLPAALVSLAVLALAALGIGLLRIDGLAMGAVAAILLGLAAGAEIDLLAYLTASQFGQREYGAIYGWQYSVFALGYGLSPFALGLMRDATGDYALALAVSCLLVGVAALLMLGLRGHARTTSDCREASPVPSITAK
jgi:predicted MFS family arabinose efflux permease